MLFFAALPPPFLSSSGLAFQSASQLTSCHRVSHIFAFPLYLSPFHSSFFFYICHRSPLCPLSLHSYHLLLSLPLSVWNPASLFLASILSRGTWAHTHTHTHTHTKKDSLCCSQLMRTSLFPFPKQAHNRKCPRYLYGHQCINISRRQTRCGYVLCYVCALIKWPKLHRQLFQTVFPPPSDLYASV